MNIKELRKFYHLGQKELANFLGILQPALSQYENDKIQMPFGLQHKVAMLFETTIDFLQSDLRLEMENDLYFIHRHYTAYMFTLKYKIESTFARMTNIKMLNFNPFTLTASFLYNGMWISFFTDFFNLDINALKVIECVLNSFE